MIPRRSRGRQSPEAEAKFSQELGAFVDLLLQMDSTLDFKGCARGWCYQLEPHGLEKGDFDDSYQFAFNSQFSIHANHVMERTYSGESINHLRAFSSWSTTSSRLLNIRLGNHFSRISSHMCSTGFNSGLYDGSHVMVMFSGIFRLLALCHPA